MRQCSETTPDAAILLRVTWRDAIARITRRPLAVLWLIAFGVGSVVAVSAHGWLVRIAASVTAIAAARLAVRSLRT
jgi:hypothetical protein